MILYGMASHIIASHHISLLSHHTALHYTTSRITVSPHQTTSVSCTHANISGVYNAHGQICTTDNRDKYSAGATLMVLETIIMLVADKCVILPFISKPCMRIYLCSHMYLWKHSCCIQYSLSNVRKKHWGKIFWGWGQIFFGWGQIFWGDVNATLSHIILSSTHIQVTPL